MYLYLCLCTFFFVADICETGWGQTFFTGQISAPIRINYLLIWPLVTAATAKAFNSALEDKVCSSSHHTHTHMLLHVKRNIKSGPSADSSLMICVFVCFLRGENVEEAFLEAAKRIYQNIQDGSLDLNAAESGVQHKPSAPQGGRLNADSQPAKEGCSC